MQQERIKHLVYQYMIGQGWELEGPEEVARQVIESLKEQTLASEVALKSVVYQAVWRCYTPILYAYCQDTASEKYERAWQETREWLMRGARSKLANESDQDDMVQETLIKLQTRIGQCRQPAAFLAFATKVLINTIKDAWKKEQTVKKGGGQVLSLNKVIEAHSDSGDDDRLYFGEQDERQTERLAATLMARQRLSLFLQEHFPSAFQREVLMIILADDVTKSAEIAKLLGRKPHQIRQVRSRLQNGLRNLLPDALDELREILEALPD